MNLILLNKSDLAENNTAILKDRRHQHIKKILKSAIGDQLCVGMINGKIGTGTIKEITAEHTKLDIVLKNTPPKMPELTLILALPRPIVLKRMLATIASLGVKDIYLIQTNRVEKSYWKSPVLDKENITNQFMLGLEQAKDTFMPNIHLKRRFKPFVEDELPAIIKGKTAIIAHPACDRKHSKTSKTPLVLAIGPEGGFIPYEIGHLSSIGFKPVNFGQRILRVETALPFVLGKLI